MTDLKAVEPTAPAAKLSIMDPSDELYDTHALVLATIARIVQMNKETGQVDDPACTELCRLCGAAARQVERVADRLFAVPYHLERAAMATAMAAEGGAA